MRACCIGLLAAILAAVSLPTSASAASVQLTWDDLIPSPTEIDNPFERLTEDQIDLLRTVLRARDRGDATVPEATKAEGELEAQGLDVDGLLAKRLEVMEQRRAAAEAVDESLDGSDVKMPGYLLPLSFDGTKTTEFLLVPYVGACIHVPPPPPNQIVHVRFDEGYEPQGMFTPVWVEGTMGVGQSEQELSLVDGSQDIAVGYEIAADSVIKYSQ